MAFVERKQATYGTTPKYRKTEFLSLPVNTSSTIRMLEGHPYDVKYHWINRATVKCLGEDCPICHSNQELYMQYPTTYRTMPQYNMARTRYYINVLDKTVAKVCGSCGEEVKDNTAMMCPKCRTSLATISPEPLNKVKVFARGPQVFDAISDANDAVFGADGQKLGIMNYDITLVVRQGQGNRINITSVPNQSATAPIPEGLDLFDLEKAIIELTPSEMLELSSGASLKDIFVARRASEPQQSSSREAVVTTSTTASMADVQDEIASRVDRFFSSNN